MRRSRQPRLPVQLPVQPAELNSPDIDRLGSRRVRSNTVPTADSHMHNPRWFPVFSSGLLPLLSFQSRCSHATVAFDFGTADPVSFSPGVLCNDAPVMHPSTFVKEKKALHGDETPELQEVALRVLSQVCGVGAAERT